MSIDVHGRSHVRAGVRDGGQFSAETRAEPTFSLAAATTVPPRADGDVWDQIAGALGVSTDWDASAQTQQVADLIAATGRPHPGDCCDVDDYRRQLEAWARDNPIAGARATDRDALSGLALDMVRAESWDADMLDRIAAAVATTGRPHPGDVEAARYLGTLRKWRFENGLAADDGPLAYVARISDEQDQAMLGNVFEILAARGDVPDAAFWAVDDVAMSEARAEHFYDALDAIADELDAMDLPPRTGQDPFDHLDEECQAAGLPVVGAALRELHEDGAVSMRTLAGVDCGTITDLYERRLGPAIDRYERALLDTYPEDRR